MNLKQTLMKRLIAILALFVCFGLCPSSAMRQKAEVESSIVADTKLELTKENLTYILKKYNVHHEDIVVKQAILETGNFKSSLCRNYGNLFGIRKGNSYAHFSHWTESVIAYRDKVQYKYRKGEDYFAFLLRIGYAQDPNYINKVKRI